VGIAARGAQTARVLVLFHRTSVYKHIRTNPTGTAPSASERCGRRDVRG
jgi:hypothetical protein